jgi:hypothetical protein
MNAPVESLVLSERHRVTARSSYLLYPEPLLVTMMV